MIFSPPLIPARLVRRYGTPMRSGGTEVWAFPDAAALAGAREMDEHFCTALPALNLQHPLTRLLLPLGLQLDDYSSYLLHLNRDGIHDVPLLL